MAKRISATSRRLVQLWYTNIPIVILFCILFTALILKTENKVVTKEKAYIAEYDLVKLPVPQNPVRPGTKLSDIQIKYVDFPKHQVPSGAIYDLSELANGVATVALASDWPLFRENFSHLYTANPVIERIPDGMRAMTIKVDATSAVEGWASSGSIVDVLLIEKEQTIVVAQKVKVLSAERSLQPTSESETPSIPSTVTLLVTQEQCMAINTANSRGRIAFALRSLNDSESWSRKFYSAEFLKTGVGGENSEISGYLRVKNGKSFALIGEKWVSSQQKPSGILLED